jgi:hypothetical protein
LAENALLEVHSSLGTAVLPSSRSNDARLTLVESTMAIPPHSGRIQVSSIDVYFKIYII